MCYTIEKNLTREQLELRFGAAFKPNRPYSPGKRVSGFSLPEVPVIKSVAPENINTLLWGLIPYWVENELMAADFRTKTLNAKAETLLEKPSFRHTLKNQRCLVLTNGFYEWQHQGKLKIPYYISLKEDIAMPMAGLYDSWTNKNTGEVIESFTIVTTQANALMEKIHNTKKRMPVIFTKETEKNWIDPDLSTDRALSLLMPLNDDLLRAERVDDAGWNRPDKGQQKSLF